MYGIGVNKPELNAIIPTVGFTLSTLSLPYVKHIWVYSKKKRNVGDASENREDAV